MDPTRIGPYVIEEKIGAGGMGTVYRAHHDETQQQVAVKILPALLAREPGFVARFTREIDALQQLRNPHIVQLFEHGVDDDTYYYAMEFVDGETLTDRLKRDKRIPWPQVIDMSVQICTALKAAHNAGIIHRDLKPSNLLIRPDGTVKLTDFGVAQVFASDKLTITGGVIGTAEYMSPEQAQGKRATKQSDLYSLGAVMYVMLTGRPPFTGKTTFDIARKHQTGQFDSPRMIVPEIPFWLDEVVCKCLEKRPEDRFPDAYVLSLRLQEIPKKVELSQKSQAVAFGDASASAETQAGDGGQKERDIGGTMLRDLLRAEVQESLDTHPLLKLLDNVWVLLALLALLVLGGLWWFRPRQVPPEEMLARAEVLMSKPAGPAWREARDQYLLPLLQQDESRWGPEVRPYLQQIELDGLLERFRKPERNGASPSALDPEVDRLLQRAAAELDAGQTGRSLQTLSALADILAEDSAQQTTRDALRTLVEQMSAAHKAAVQPFIDASLKRAREALTEGNREAAVTIWQGLIDLYDADPQAAESVRQAHDALAATMAADSSTTHPSPP